MEKERRIYLKRLKVYNKNEINKIENENLVRSLKPKVDSFNRLTITKFPAKQIKKREEVTNV